ARGGVATDVGAGQTQRLPDVVDQELPGLDVCLVAGAVDAHFDVGHDASFHDFLCRSCGNNATAGVYPRPGLRAKSTGAWTLRADTRRVNGDEVPGRTARRGGRRLRGHDPLLPVPGTPSGAGPR